MMVFLTADDPVWYKVIGWHEPPTPANPEGDRFGVWHCATEDQADTVMTKWRASTLISCFEIRRMRAHIHLDTERDLK